MENELVYRHRDSKKGSDWRLYVKVMRVSRLVIDNRNYAELLLVRCIGSSFTCRYSIFRDGRHPRARSLSSRITRINGGSRLSAKFRLLALASLIRRRRRLQ